MTDVVTAPTPAAAAAPAEPIELAFFGDAPADESPHRQINERRARVENPELLRRLRGL